MKHCAHVQPEKESREKPALPPQAVQDRAHTGDLPSNNMKPRVRTSGDWFRQHVTGSEEAEIAGDQSGQHRLYRGGGLVLGEG